MMMKISIDLFIAVLVIPCRQVLVIVVQATIVNNGRIYNIHTLVVKMIDAPQKIETKQ